jgi:type IV fimbrial biogenesis protein FimT
MKKSHGITLIELLISLSIFAMIAFLGASYLQISYKKNQIEIAVEEVEAAMHFARTEALLTGSDLALSPFPAATDWSSGMVLFIDNTVHQFSAGTQAIHFWEGQSSDIHISWHGFISKRYLLFSSDIRKNAVNGFFLIQNNSEYYKLIVNRLGRVRRAEHNYTHDV